MSEYSKAMIKLWTFLLLGLIFSIWFYTSNAESADWRSDFTGRNQGSCCDEHDCWKVFARIISDNGDTMTIEVDGVLVENFPKEGFHASQDNDDWVCKPFYDGHEVGEKFLDATGKEDTKGECVVGTKNPDCYNCIFISPGM